MNPILGVSLLASFLQSAGQRTKNWLFGSRVHPRPGSVLHCALVGFLEHSGVFVDRDHIAELEGKGAIRCINPPTFLSSSFMRGTRIYVACDQKTGVVLGRHDIAERAWDMEGEGRDYNIILDNCHQFSSGCITGKFENPDNPFNFLEDTICKELNWGQPISWLVWDHEVEDEASEDGLDEQLETACSGLDYELLGEHNIARQGSMRGQLHEELRSWHQQVANEMREKFAPHFVALEQAEASLAAGNSTREEIQNDLEQFRAADAKVDVGFWEKELAQHGTDELVAVRMALHAHWRKSLEQQQNAYYLNELARRRAELRKELDGRLVAMQSIAEVASELGMEPGLLWDQSKGIGVKTDLKTLQRWADYLKNNEGVRKLCDLLGRMRRYSESQRMELIKTSKTYHVCIPDIEAKSEIVGLTQGRDLVHILPQELALFADEDTEILFDLKFAEAHLMSFGHAGMIEKSYEREHEEMAQVAEQDKLGPMIICVDTSGSMSGEPESVAKAITLALAMKSMEQKRDCYLISFSTGIETRDLSTQRGLAELLDFLQSSFGGGTDGAPALHHAIEKMAEESYARADLLMISDFGMPEITPALRKKMAEARQLECKFFALNIGAVEGESFQHKDFDAEWQYNPATIGVIELYGIVDAI